MRSESVVLPASMWAMMPMLRTRSRFTGDLRQAARARTLRRRLPVRNPAARRAWPLPGEVGVGLVGLGHLVRVLAHGPRRTLAVEGVEQFLGQAAPHGLALLGARG